MYVEVIGADRLFFTEAIDQGDAPIWLRNILDVDLPCEVMAAVTAATDNRAIFR